MVDRRVLTLLQQLMQQGIGDERVLKAMAEVPRENSLMRPCLTRPTTIRPYR